MSQAPENNKLCANSTSINDSNAENPPRNHCLGGETLNGENPPETRNFFLTSSDSSPPEVQEPNALNEDIVVDVTPIEYDHQLSDDIFMSSDMTQLSSGNQEPMETDGDWEKNKGGFFLKKEIENAIAIAPHPFFPNGFPDTDTCQDEDCLLCIENNRLLLWIDQNHPYFPCGYPDTGTCDIDDCFICCNEVWKPSAVDYFYDEVGHSDHLFTPDGTPDTDACDEDDCAICLNFLRGINSAD